MCLKCVSIVFPSQSLSIKQNSCVIDFVFRSLGDSSFRLMYGDLINLNVFLTIYVLDSLNIANTIQACNNVSFNSVALMAKYKL